jgi:hypothetical protein
MDYKNFLKNVILIIMIVRLSNCYPAFKVSDEQLWESYKISYNKVYANESDDAKR